VRKVFFIEENHRLGQGCSSSDTTSEGVSMLLALVALDGMDSTGLEREVLLLLPLELPRLARAGEEFVALAELADVERLLLLLRSDTSVSTAIGRWFSALVGLRR
jgi:hypothetical protein